MKQKQKKQKKPAWPIYLAAITWFACTRFLPMYNLGGFLPTLIITIIVWRTARRFSNYLLEKRAAKAMKTPAPEAEKPPEKKTSYGPEVDAILEENHRAQHELGRLYASIRDGEVKKKIREIMEISDKIAKDAISDPGDVSQIKKFQSYYLPTTIKLLNAYDRMGAQGIDGENISGTMRSIEQMLDTAIDAYKKQLDSLFANQALDIETDIEVMNTMLKRQGLAN